MKFQPHSLTIVVSMVLSINAFAQKVGIGSTQFVPASTLDVMGGLTVGAGYASVNTAPANGALFQGNVGIGSTSPAFKLDVTGAGRFTTGVYPGNQSTDYFTWDGSGISKGGVGYTYISQGYLYVQSLIVARTGIYNDAASYLTINGGTSNYTDFLGNVGIGTSNPGALLWINHNGASAYGTALQIQTTGGSDGPRVAFQAYNGGSPKTWNHGIRNSGTSYGIFEDGSTGGFGTERLTILAGGSVGIGSTSPGYTLDLNGGTLGFGASNVRTESRDNAGLQGNAGAQSGFFQTASPTNYPAGASSWWHMIDCRHSNAGNNYALQISGSFFDQDLYFRKTNGSPTTAWTKFVTSANIASYLSGSSGWGLTGNAGTVDGTNFLGTTDNIPLSFRVNNQNAGRIDQNNANSFFGFQAGNANSGGTYNTAIGYQALPLNTSGYQNIAIGYYALWQNVSGNNNVAVGNQALAFNSVPCFRYGNNNTAIGYQAGYGAYAGESFGDYNVSVGSNAGTGYSGSNNVAMGYTAMLFSTSGSNNVGIGSGALYTNTGSNNVALGTNALYGNYGGNNNTAIGNSATVAAGGYFNATAIGNSAVANNTNDFMLGNGVGTLRCQVALTVLSDQRVKNNVKENIPGLDFIKLLRPVAYHLDFRKEQELMGIKDQPDYPGKYDVEKVNFSGFIAQEVEQAAAKVGYDFSGLHKPANSKDLYGLAYATFVVPLVKSVQELDAKNESLLAEIKTLKEGMLKQEAMLIEMQKQMAELKSTTTLKTQAAVR